MTGSLLVSTLLFSLVESDDSVSRSLLSLTRGFNNGLKGKPMLCRILFFQRTNVFQHRLFCFSYHLRLNPPVCKSLVNDIHGWTGNPKFAAYPTDSQGIPRTSWQILPVDRAATARQPFPVRWHSYLGNYHEIRLQAIFCCPSYKLSLWY